jgi:hypothetical protein
LDTFYNFLQEKYNIGHTIVEILTRTLDQKRRLLAKEKFLPNKQTLNINTQMTIISHLSTMVHSIDIFSGEPGESAQLRFALKNFGRISSELDEFRPLFSRRICWFGEISPKSKEIRPKILGRNLTARIRPFRARKIITVYMIAQSIKKIWYFESGEVIADSADVDFFGFLTLNPVI